MIIWGLVQTLLKDFLMIKKNIEIVFLGTGTSEGVPRVSCLTNNSNCKVCNDAIKPNSKNRRLNTSILVKIKDAENQKSYSRVAQKYTTRGGKLFSCLSSTFIGRQRAFSLS